MNASRAAMAPMRRVPMHHEFIIATNAGGRAFLWRAGCDHHRFLCVRWTLMPDEVARIQSESVHIERLIDRNPVHGNFDNVAGAFAFFADLPDAKLAGFANTLLGRIGTVRSESRFGDN